MSFLNDQRFIVIEKQNLSIRFRSILERAYQISRIEKRPLNAEPLMLAILEQRDCDVTEALRSLGVTSETFRKALEKVAKPKYDLAGAEKNKRTAEAHE